MNKKIITGALTAALLLSTTGAALATTPVDNGPGSKPPQVARTNNARADKAMTNGWHCHLNYNGFYGQWVSVCAKGNPAWHPVVAPKNGPVGSVANEEHTYYGYALQELKANEAEPGFSDYYFVIYSYPSTDDKGREVLGYDVAGFRNADLGF